MNENYPTYLFRRFIDNDEQTYHAVIIVKNETMKYIPDKRDQIAFIEEYLRELFTSLTKTIQKMPFIYDEIISYIKGEIDFYETAKGILEEDS